MINGRAEEEIGIVQKAINKAVNQSSQNTFVGVFLTFCKDGLFTSRDDCVNNLSYIL